MRTAGRSSSWSTNARSGRFNVTESRIVLTELLLLGLVLGVYVRFGVKIYLAGFLPASEANDGIGYFVGARSFFLNHELRAPLMHLGLVSPIGAFYSHGFAYSLINGGVALLLGWHDKLIVAINVILLTGAVIFVLMQAQAWRWKLALLLLVLTYYITPSMTFAYMQETVHLLLALVMGGILIRIIDREQVARDWSLIAGYCILMAGCALLRPTWVFWAAGLVAIARSRRDFVLLAFLALLYLAMGYLSLKLLFAPYPYYAPYQAATSALADHQWIAAIRAAAEALRQNAAKLLSNQFYMFGETWIPNAYTCAIIGVTAYLYSCYRIHRDRRALAVALIATAYIGAIFVVYDVLAGARMIAAVFVLQLFYLTTARKTTLVVALMLAQIAMLPTVTGITDRILGFQINAGEDAIKNGNRLQHLGNIASAIEIGRDATIYLDNALTNVQYPLTTHLPLRSRDGHALRYSQDFLATKPMAEREFDSSYLDFVLAADPLSHPGLTVVYNRGLLHLYRVKND